MNTHPDQVAGKARGALPTDRGLSTRLYSRVYKVYKVGFTIDSFGRKASVFVLSKYHLLCLILSNRGPVFEAKTRNSGAVF